MISVNVYPGNISPAAVLGEQNVNLKNLKTASNEYMEVSMIPASKTSWIGVHNYGGHHYEGDEGHM